VFFSCHGFQPSPAVFSRATWTRLFERRGFSVEVVEERTDDDRSPRLMFLGRKAS
jgi:hypothetical protein